LEVVYAGASQMLQYTPDSSVHLLPFINVVAISIEGKSWSSGRGTSDASNIKSSRSSSKVDGPVLSTFEMLFQEGVKHKRVSLVKRKIQSVPADIQKLKSLVFLDLENNEIKSLPSEIGELPKLLELYVPANQLKELPASLENLNLEIIGLAGNQFEQFPMVITRLKKIKAIDLGGNKITSVPTEITNLKNLSSLFLAGNKIEFLPQDLSALTKLKVLDLTGNPIAIEEQKRIKKALENV
jgi:Leucine-rich repeat (LRR) protein